MKGVALFSLFFTPLVIFSGILLVVRHPADSNRILTSGAGTITGVERTLTGQ